ncbi:MAG TPA: twin-arginine translocation signal domain-containing protein, partial [Acidimicrobiales bacterium]|nr:twin-arginine translocation signal domain-containing protein [Acidimicrobiales bacterium]
MRGPWTRRDFLTLTGAGAVTLGLAACSGGEGDAADGDGGSDHDEDAGARSPDGVIAEADVPDRELIMGWISEVFSQGVRRPGYPADVWAEEWIAERFRDTGLEDVRLEPIQLTRWEPTAWSLEVAAGGETRSLDCFPVPYAAPAEGLHAELAAFDQARPEVVAGKGSLYDVTLLNIPADLLVTA